MKKALLLMLALVLCFALVGCGEQEDVTNNDNIEPPVVDDNEPVEPVENLPVEDSGELPDEFSGDLDLVSGEDFSGELEAEVSGEE